MVSKRKQNRKVKREIRRKVMQKKAQNQQQTTVPKDQEMMLKLMAMLKGGGGGNGQPMDTSTFLRLKEEATAKSNENARLIREAKLKAKQNQSEQKAAEQEFQVKQARAKADDASRDLVHQQLMMKLKGTAQGLDDHLRDINREIQESQQKIELNNQNASLDAKRAEVDKLKLELERIKKRLDYKTASPEIRENITNALDNVQKLFAQISVVFDNIDKKQATEIELHAVDELVGEIQPKMQALIGQNEILNHETQILQDDIKTKHDLTAAFRKEKKDLIETQHRMNHLMEQRKTADHLPEYDESGNVKMKYRENLREEIEPENNEKVLKIVAEGKRIEEHLTRLTGKGTGTDWASILFAHGNSLSKDVKDVIQQLEGKVKYTSPLNNKTYNSYEKLRDYYKSLNDMYDQAHAKAERKYNEAKKFNEDLKQNPVIETKQVSRDMLSELRLRKAEKDRAIEAINTQIQDKQKLAREVEKLQIDIKQIESDLSKMPASVDMSSEINALAETNAQLATLLRTKAQKQEESEYHDQLQKKTRDTVREINVKKAHVDLMKPIDSSEAVSNLATAKRALHYTEKDLDFAKSKEESVHNLRKQTESKRLDVALKEKELEQIKEQQGDFDTLTDELVANEAETSTRKRLLGLKEQTYKAENEARAAKAHLSQLETENYLRTQQEIADAKSKLDQETEKAKQMENLVNERKAFRKVQAQRRALSQQLDSKPGQVSDESLETLAAVQHRVLEAEKEAEMEEQERGKEVNAFFREAEKKSDMLDAFNDYGTGTSSSFKPYDSLDALKADRSALLTDDGWEFLNDFKSEWTGEHGEEE